MERSYERAGNGTRTRDPNLGKVVLYQLSYSRNFIFLLLRESEVSTRRYQRMADGSGLISLSGDFRRSDGGEGNRTPDLLNAIQALSQLSYAPGRQEPRTVPKGSRKVKKTGLAKVRRASILQHLFHP